MTLTVAEGLPDALRADAARLYLEAFWGKLGPVLGPDPARASALFAERLRPDRAIAAHEEGRRLLGVAGFKDAEAGLFDIGAGDLRRAFGLWGGTWRALALAALERPVAADELLMDGLCVAADARGLGVGSKIMAEIDALARRRGAASVRLDVIDGNAGARRLYERLGYAAEETTRAGPFRRLFNFESSTRMRKRLPPQAGPIDGEQS